MSNKPKKVLVIEDDLGMVKILEKWLPVSGYQVERTLEGEIGVEKAKDIQPDIILIDLMLPDIGGTEVARRLKADPLTQDIPFIFMTAYMGVEQDKGDEEIEVDGEYYRVFAKPLHNKKLLSEMRKVINRRIHNNPQ